MEDFISDFIEKLKEWKKKDNLLDRGYRKALLTVLSQMNLTELVNDFLEELEDYEEDLK